MGVRGVRGLITLLLLLIQDLGGRGQELNGRGLEDMGRSLAGEGKSRIVVIQIEDTTRQPYNCSAFLDTLEVRRIHNNLKNGVQSLV